MTRYQAHLYLEFPLTSVRRKSFLLAKKNQGRGILTPSHLVAIIVRKRGSIINEILTFTACAPVYVDVFHPRLFFGRARKVFFPLVIYTAS